MAARGILVADDFNLKAAYAKYQKYPFPVARIKAETAARRRA